MSTYPGGCHCGQLTFTFDTERVPEDWTVRACTCRFCKKHQPRYVTDPGGRVQLQLGSPPLRYRFGTGSAEFVFCSNCGVFVAVVDASGASPVALINANALERVPEGVPEARRVSFDGESRQARHERRQASWTPLARVG